MANYKIAEKLTGNNEGGYANNKADTGGRTINGISYNNWPTWAGWPRVMAIIKRVGENARLINAEVKKDSVLLELISAFYKKNFWDVNLLDKIDDQQIANTVYDFGVNSGTGRAAKFLQQSVNNLAESNIPVDGQVGPRTISAVNRSNAGELHDMFNGKREAFYRSIAKGNQAQFLPSWLSRLKSYKTT